MSDHDSIGESFGMLIAGGVVGFALYFLATGLGGRGGGSGGERGEVPMSPMPSPSPSIPKDNARLVFVMIEPTVVGNPAGFRLLGEDPKKIYSTDALIARVKAGGRADVQLRASGSVIQRAWDEARDFVKRAGLAVWVAESPTGVPHVVGNVRGFYGRRFG